MYNLRGFIRVAALINNLVGSNSPIGEPSTLALTYTRERGEYFNNLYPGLNLVGISSVDTVIGRVPVDAEFANHILEVASWAIAYATTKAGAINSTDLVADVSAQFTTKMIGLSTGTLVGNGTISLPAFMAWNNPLLPGNTLRIWFSDAAFRAQYTSTEIVVIAPVANLNDFFLPASQVKTIIESRTAAQATDFVQVAKQGNPETVQRTISYDYKNPSSLSVTFPTNWNVLIYGAAGDNIDFIKDAIIAHILANTTYTREQWAVVLPDLFKRTEFNILPRWDKFSIPNLTVQTGIYSPVINLKEAITFTKARIPEIASIHIDNHAAIFGVTYKSLALVVVSNPDNLNSNFSITDIFPDYMDIGTSSLDFARQSTKTQEWAIMIQSLLLVAEVITDLIDPPFGIRRVKRGNTLYVAKVYDTVQYLVAAKSSYPI